MRPYVAEIARIADTNICIYPNAGLPNEFGEYDQLADEMAVIVGEFATSGLVNILGGAVAQHRSIFCNCRSGGESCATHLAKPEQHLRLSGLEPFAKLGNPFCECRRAHQRDRLGTLQETHLRG